MDELIDWSRQSSYILSGDGEDLGRGWEGGGVAGLENGHWCCILHINININIGHTKSIFHIQCVSRCTSCGTRPPPAPLVPPTAHDPNDYMDIVYSHTHKFHTNTQVILHSKRGIVDDWHAPTHSIISNNLMMVEKVFSLDCS